VLLAAAVLAVARIPAASSGSGEVGLCWRRWLESRPCPAGGGVYGNVSLKITLRVAQEPSMV
jgi:hypothetical protein